MIRRPGAALALVAALFLAACATPAARPRAAAPPRVLCLDEPGRGAPGDTERPLFFFFCIQSP